MRREVFDGKVGDHKVPTVTNQPLGIWFDTFCLGLFSALFASLASHRSACPYGHKTTTFTRFTRHDLKIDDIPAMATEMFFECFAGCTSKAQGERHPRQPKCFTAFYLNEFRKGKIHHIPEHEIVLPNDGEKFLAYVFVLFSGAMERMGTHLRGKQIVRKIDFHPGGAAMSVATGGKDSGIGFWHGLDRRILHQNAADDTEIFGRKARGKTLPEESMNHPGEEGGGRLRKASEDRLTADIFPASLRQSDGDLIV